MKKLILLITITFFTITIYALSDEEFNKAYKNQLDFARITLNQEINEQSIPGYVYFKGFDFEGYTAESDGIEPMLKVTLELLKEKYGNTNQPFVFVGHSQGGLRALAMSTYLRQKNPQLYKQLRGVITLSGIDKGLKLLENKMRGFYEKNCFNFIRYNFTKFNFYKLHSRRYCRRLLYKSIHLNSILF